MNSDIQYIAFAKGAERYVFAWTEATRAELLRTFGRFASNPELSFSWLDACRLSMKVRAMAGECVGK